MSSVGQISQDEAKNFKVSRFIHGRHGFIISDLDTLSQSEWIKVHHFVSRSFLFLSWKKQMQVINLHLEKPNNWVMNVYGRSFYDHEAKQLAEELAKEFKVHVHVKLVQENEGKEEYI